ncbi:shadow of prion protein 2 [Scomber japonicus]|uniref:shadow of prion protein 2 n=1 Tax=Scomber japonicus TaxID=13676 RepID=UPI002306C49E|nr:shadow of prion protein 2 [Scomber japonicus]
MTGQQKLLSLWLWLLLMVALCPGAQYAYSKRGGFFKSGKDKKSDSKEAPPSQSRGLSKNGLKWAGAAAAGMLGGTGTGYGLGFLGKPKYGSKSHHGHKTSSSEGDQRVYYQENQRYHNQSRWRAYVKSGAPAPMSNIFLTLGYAVPLLIAAWMRVI